MTWGSDLYSKSNQDLKEIFMDAGGAQTIWTILDL